MARNNKRKIYDSSSDDDDENLSLSVLKDSQPKMDLKSLLKDSTEMCEFCDKVSKNRYSSYIHNARHIIIPLINLNIFQCGECLHHFTSDYDLNTHIAVKHIITQFETKIVLVKTPQLTETIDINSDSDDDETTLIHMKTKTIMGVNKIGNNDKYESKIGNSIKNGRKIENNMDACKMGNSNDYKIEYNPNFNINKNVYTFGNSKTNVSQIKDGTNYNSNTNVLLIGNNTNLNNSESHIGNNFNTNSNQKSDFNSIKSRLVFEDDDDIVTITPENVITDLITECKVNLEIPPWLENNEFEGKSVHYSDLLEWKEYFCKKCQKPFPNRYKSIVHETKHISLEKTQINYCKLCQRYIPGYLTHHIVKKHPFNAENIPTTCTKCGMKYTNYETHNRTECLGINVTYKEKSSILQLCDLCFSFCRSNNHKMYNIVGVKNQLGKRTNCDRCNIQCFDINLVERLIRYKGRTGNAKPKKKVTSNEERLKIIKQRLKMMKK